MITAQEVTGLNPVEVTKKSLNILEIRSLRIFYFSFCTIILLSTNAECFFQPQYFASNLSTSSLKAEFSLERFMII